MLPSALEQRREYGTETHNGHDGLRSSLRPERQCDAVHAIALAVGGGRRRRRGRDGRRSVGNGPRCGCRALLSLPVATAFGSTRRSSASRYRCRIWWRRNRGRARRRCSGMCPCVLGEERLVPALGAASRSTAYCSGVRSERHSASVFVISNVSATGGGERDEAGGGEEKRAAMQHGDLRGVRSARGRRRRGRWPGCQGTMM